MIDSTADRRAPISPQLAMRVATLGTIAFVLFAIIFFRLWFLQVLTGDQFLAQATQNGVRNQPVPAPRGFIVDREGNALVQNRKGTVLELDPSTIPEEERTLAAAWGKKASERLERPKGRRGEPVPIPPAPPSVRARFKRLGKVTELTVAELQELVIVGLYRVPYSPVRVAQDVAPAVRNYVAEYAEDFPGLEARTVFLREYPNGRAGAQLFGLLSEIGPDQLGADRYRGVKKGSVVGQGGLERTYDRYLRGRDGVERTYVDAAGRPLGAVLARPATVGNQLRTSLDSGLQKVGQAALERVAKDGAGAYLAMDPYTGRILAMGSAPTFDPNELAGPLTDERADEIFKGPSAALTNRAVSSLYSTGSTFKPVTALAALSAGVTSPSRVILDQGKKKLFPNDPRIYQNAKAKSYGPVDLRRALVVSSDIYFYIMGKELQGSKRPQALQTWARRLGFGRLTGIDTGAETKGVVPGEAWRDALNRREATCRAGRVSPSGRKKPVGAPCGIADGFNRPYGAGDNVNLAIGQGDFQATPLQVALSYAAIATGGRIPTPHLGVQIEDEQGRLVQKLKPPIKARTVRIPAEGLETVRAGLRAAASEPGGTSADVFAGWDHASWPVHGKTGTAQYDGKDDQSWYAAYVPRTATNPKALLVVTTVEQGGFGAETAAPMACELFAQWYGASVPCNAGSDASR